MSATLDAFETVLQETWRPPGPHPAVVHALAAFDRAPTTASIARVTDIIGLSAKRFIERFKSEVGVTPKRYCRIRRFQHALAVSHQDRHVDWTRVALDCGYFDQAHFIHDFRSFAGITPTGYQSARTSFQTHTSNFYNPAQAVFETMTPWQIQKIPIVPLHPTSSYPMRMRSSLS